MSLKWDRHEIDVRGRILQILQANETPPNIYGIPKEVNKRIAIYRRNDLHELTEQIYWVVRKEMGHERPPEQDSELPSNL